MTLRQQIRWNRLLTGELLVFFALLIGGVGAALYAAYGGPAAIAVAVGGVSWALFSWFLSTRVVAAVTGAKPVTKAEQPELYRRIVFYKSERFVADIRTRGFLYELTPPVPIDVLPGNIRSDRKVPPRDSAPARPD